MNKRHSKWNIDRHNESSNNRLWEIKNKDKRNQQRTERFSNKKYRRKQNDTRNASRKIAYEKQRDSVFKIIGGYVCVDCGFDDPRAMQIEHIHDTGNLDKKRFARHDQMFRYYKSHPIEAFENLEPVCANCNQIRIHERSKK